MTSHQDSWEKSFEDRFGCICDDVKTPNHTASSCRGAFDIDELKDFIRSLLLQAEQKGRDWGEKNEFQNSGGRLQEAHDDGYQAGLAERTKEIEEKLDLYFEGLIVVMDPQATYKSLKRALLSK